MLIEEKIKSHTLFSTSVSLEHIQLNDAVTSPNDPSPFPVTMWPNYESIFAWFRYNVTFVLQDWGFVENTGGKMRGVRLKKRGKVGMKKHTLKLREVLQSWTAAVCVCA